VAKTEYISEAAMTERDGIGNDVGTAKHDANEPSSVGTLVRTPLAVAFGADGGERSCPLWDGHIIDATFPLVNEPAL
jgi:hypothetical protein